MNTLQTTIMRRVYISYGLSYLEQPLLWSGLVLGGGVALLGRWTHVASITDNLLATPLGAVPNYLISSFTTAVAAGELATVLIVLVLAVTSSVTLYQLQRLAHTFGGLHITRLS